MKKLKLTLAFLTLITLLSLSFVMEVIFDSSRNIEQIFPSLLKLFDFCEEYIRKNRKNIKNTTL